MAEITTTQTMGNKTITTTINTAARGPAGSDATVTAANVLTAMEAMDAAQESSSRVAIKAQSKAVGFFDDFSRSDLYVDNDTITHMASTPEIGNAWRIFTTGAASVPKVSGGYFQDTGTNGLVYLGSSVSADESGKFTLGYKFKVDVTEYFLTGGASNNIQNVSFLNTQILPDGGGILPAGVVHINFSILGIASCDFYGAGGSTALTCLNGTIGSEAIPWSTTVTQIAPGRDYSLLFEVEGDFLTVTLVGVGSLRFYHADLSTKMGATMYFWWEPNAKAYNGTNYKYLPKLKQVWAEAEALNQNPDFGNYAGGNLTQLASGGVVSLPNTVTVSQNNAGMLYAAAMTLAASRYNFRAGGQTTSTIGGYAAAEGGHVFIEGGYLANVDGVQAGAQLVARAPMNADPSFTTILSSAAGAETTLKSLQDVITLRAGDHVEYQVFGQLNTANAKKIRVLKNWGGTTNVDVYLDTTTALDALTGPFKLTVYRGTSAASSHVVFCVMEINGQTPIIQRASVNRGYSFSNIEFRTTGVAAGDITFDFMKYTVHRVKSL